MSSPLHWAVIPAAGVGRRMGSDRPKQYLDLHGRPIIAHTVARLSAHPLVAGVVVAIAADDRWWDAASREMTPAPARVAGGAQRCHSVLNALEWLASRGERVDGVLVHDAVRPCLRAADVDRLFEAAAGHPDGGLLAVPVRDTMKLAGEDGVVARTIERTRLWHAQTPQLFPLERLASALGSAVRDGGVVTDEAQAMELAGARPRLVEGHADNIKITTPEDLALAALFLEREEHHR